MHLKIVSHIWTNLIYITIIYKYINIIKYIYIYEFKKQILYKQAYIGCLMISCG